MSCQKGRTVNESRIEGLIGLARKYVWWKSPDEAIKYPRRIIAQVMDIGTLEDIELLVRLVGEETLKDTIAQAEAGQFRPRSWAYWHYRLGLADVDQVPKMPRRKIS